LKNRIIYDYFSFTSKIHSPENLVEILGFDGIKFQLFRGFYGYKDRLYYDGIHIHYNGTEDMGVCVEMTGQGCRNFETHGTGDYDGIFALILEHHNVVIEHWKSESEQTSKKEMNITRLDVAYDDFVGLIDLYVLMKEAQLNNFVSRFEDVEVIYSNKGCSVNHGSKKSRCYVRIYDKRMERQAFSEHDHWIRCELQLRKECALGFIKLNTSIEESYFSTLNNYLRYIIPSENESNKSLLFSSPQWIRWVESVYAESIFDKPGVEYNINRCENFVYGQSGNAVYTLIETQGVETFLKNLVEQKPRFSKKYEALLNKHGRAEDGILAFLKERKT